MKKLFSVFVLLVLLIGSFFIPYKVHAPIKIPDTKSSGNNHTGKKNINQPTTTIASTLPQTPSDTITKKNLRKNLLSFMIF